MTNSIPQKSTTSSSKKHASRFLLSLWYTFAIFIIIIAVLISIARLFTPTVARYKNEIVQAASQQVGYPIQIQSLQASWLGIRPVLKLSNVDVLSAKTKKSVIHINRIYLALDIVKFIFLQRISTTQLLLSGSTAMVWHDQKNQFWLGGTEGILLNPEKQPTGFNPLDFLFSQPKVSIKDVSIQFKNNQTPPHEIYLNELGLLNDGNQHHILTKFQVPQQHKAEFKIIAQLKGEITKPKQWHVQAFMQGHQINFDNWHAILDFFPNYQLRGKADFSVWLDWKNILHKFQMNIHWVYPKLQFTAPEYVILNNLSKLNNISGQFTWLNQQHEGWTLAGNQINLGIAEKKFSSMDFFIEKKIKKEKKLLSQTEKLLIPSSWNIYFSELNLNLLTTLNQLGFQPLKILLSSSENNETTSSSYQLSSFPHLLKVLAPQGIIHHLQLNFNHSGKKVTNYEIKAQFENLFIKNYQKWPSLRGLNGFFQATPSEGKAKFYSSNLTLYLPNLFQHSHNFKKFDLQINFKKNKNDLLVYVPVLYLKNSALETNVKFATKLPSNLLLAENFSVASSSQSSFLDTLKMHPLQLIGSIQSFKNAPLINYFPTEIMSQKLSSWLIQAIQHNPVATTSENIIFQGTLNNFPFVQHNGRFIIESALKKINLNFYPQWPAIKEIEGKLTVDTNQMFFHAEHGKIFNSTIKEATLYINDLFAESKNLYVNGRLHGSSTDGLKFLQETPLRNKLGHFIDHLLLNGNLTLDLKLDIPLTAKPLAAKQAIHYQGNVRLTENQLKLLDFNLVFDKINTLINFNQDTIKTAMVSSATLWQKPIQFAIRTVKPHAHMPNLNFNIDINGTVAIASLKKQFNFDFLNKLSGHTSYHASLSIPKNYHNPHEQNLTL